jgi:hypothetical protein
MGGRPRFIFIVATKLLPIYVATEFNAYFVATQIVSQAF